MYSVRPYGTNPTHCYAGNCHAFSFFLFPSSYTYIGKLELNKLHSVYVVFQGVDPFTVVVQVEANVFRKEWWAIIAATAFCM